jgi:hypothetical protein
MEEPRGSSGTGSGAGKKPGIFFHDAWNEYAFFFYLKKNSYDLIGADCGIMGLSRATMVSTLF